MSDVLTITPDIIANPLGRKYNENSVELSTRQAAPRVTNRLDFLKQIALFGGLTDSELSNLAGDLIPRRFHQGDMIFLQGDPGQALYIIETGRVRIYMQDEGGQETSVIFYRDGDIFGELSAIDGLPRSASAVSAEETQVWLLSRDRLRVHLRASPQLAYNFMQALSVRVRYSTLQVGNLALRDVPSRLARKLLELAQGHGRIDADGVRIDLPLTQSDLASLIGATRESINKTLSHFKREGIIRLDQNQITILDPDALREISS